MTDRLDPLARGVRAPEPQRIFNVNVAALARTAQVLFLNRVQHLGGGPGVFHPVACARAVGNRPTVKNLFCVPAGG